MTNMKADHTSMTILKAAKHKNIKVKRAQPYSKTNPTPGIYYKIVYKVLDLLNY